MPNCQSHRERFESNEVDRGARRRVASATSTPALFDGGFRPAANRDRSIALQPRTAGIVKPIRFVLPSIKRFHIIDIAKKVSVATTAAQAGRHDSSRIKESIEFSYSDRARNPVSLVPSIEPKLYGRRPRVIQECDRETDFSLPLSL